MTALLQPRGSKPFTAQYKLMPLAAGQKVFKGGIACLDTTTGTVKKGASGSTTLLVLGLFAQSVDNSAGGTSVPVNVRFAREIVGAEWFANDTSTPVVASQVGQTVFILDDQTVTGASAGNSPAGMCLAVDSFLGVLVFQQILPTVSDSTVPSIQAGTTTLVAGTKTVTGVTLTSTSRILVTMKDPGTGAITGLGSFSTPAASRNTSTGQFVINAIDDSKAVITTAISTVDYLIVG